MSSLAFVGDAIFTTLISAGPAGGELRRTCVKPSPLSCCCSAALFASFLALPAAAAPLDKARTPSYVASALAKLFRLWNHLSLADIWSSLAYLFVSRGLSSRLSATGAVGCSVFLSSLSTAGASLTIVLTKTSSACAVSRFPVEGTLATGGLRVLGEGMRPGRLVGMSGFRALVLAGSLVAGAASCCLAIDLGSIRVSAALATFTDGLNTGCVCGTRVAVLGWEFNTGMFCGRLSQLLGTKSGVVDTRGSGGSM
ncbi:hypothetical protein BOVATA_004170 [Babesia ovata]|uniref:Uncharacterized protein n=1 Tax=Babesia ovata TaxID=189622 RepID=A0A2H6K7G2_9APIC|nr:uncharacterized protein BOVATA_004170 [Babesia ovata]GBE58924.1 hypothetical protein BOVATA_004170 [Babesia ovata]